MFEAAIFDQETALLPINGVHLNLAAVRMQLEAKAADLLLDGGGEAYVLPWLRLRRLSALRIAVGDRGTTGSRRIPRRQQRRLRCPGEPSILVDARLRLRSERRAQEEHDDDECQSSDACNQERPRPGRAKPGGL